MSKSIIDLKTSEKAEIITFEGGQTLKRRLEEMGIRPGKIISKISSQPVSGPVTVSVDGQQTAIGRKMAAKVIVAPLRAHHHEPAEHH